MYELEKKQGLVIGLGERGRAACRLLKSSGANVMAVDRADTADLRLEAGRLLPLGIEVELGVTKSPNRQFSMAVISRAVPGETHMVQEMRESQLPVIGECELGYEQSHNLNIAIAGTNGKCTTGNLNGRVLQHRHLKADLCGHGAR